MLENLLLDIQQGKCHPIRMVVLMVDQEPDGRWLPTRYRAGGLTYLEELGLLAFGQSRVCQNIQDGD